MYTFKKLNKSTYRVPYSSAAEIEVGGIESENFIPGIKIKKYNFKESWFEIKFPLETQTVKEIKGDKGIEKIICKHKEGELEFYTIDKKDRMEEGGFEFEVIQNTPKNRITFDIDFCNLEFWKQLPYNEQPDSPEDTGVVTKTYNKGFDKDGKVLIHIPDNVINSYAVYRSREKGLTKLFHIFRPKIVDAAGKEIWGDLNIDIEDKKLHIDIPIDFVNTATYPIKIDPTFGYTTLGGTDVNIQNLMYGAIGNPGGNGRASSLSVGLDEWTNGQKVKMALYTTPGSFPGTGTLQSPQTNERSEGHGSPQFETFELSTQGTIISNQNYVALAWSDSTVNIRRDSGAGTNSAYASVTYGAWPATQTLSSSTNYYSTYAKYGLNPTITSAGVDSKIWPDEKSVVIAGSGFEAAKGNGKVYLGDSATFASANLHSIELINSWSNTSINVDMSTGSLAHGDLWLYVKNDGGGVSNAFPVYVSNRMRWGTDTDGPSESNPNWCRAMGGQSPNLENMILRGVAIRFGSVHSGQVRVAVYSGGDLSTGPAGATLLYDFGQTSGTSTGNFVFLYVGTDISIPKNTPLWIAFKSNEGTNVALSYASSIPATSNFQSERGRWGSVSVSADETVSFPSTWPSDAGSFLGTWWDMYLLMGIKKEAVGIKMQTDNSNYLVSVSSYTPPTNISISFWIGVTNHASYRIIGHSNAFEIRFYNRKLINEMFWGTSIVSNFTFSIDILYHIVCTRASNNSGQIILNGVVDKTGSSLNGSPGSASLYVGAQHSIEDFFDGYLEDVRIYDRVLSLAEAQTIMAARGLDSIVHGLTHRWIFQEKHLGALATGAGSIKNFMSGTNLTPTNSPIYTGSRLTLRNVE